MTLYFAYGSNLNLSQMSRRCPDATPLDKLYLPGWRMVFRGVCDVVPDETAECPGGIWRITPECEERLDRYEGYDPHYPDRGMYSKEYVEVDGLPDGETHVMMYVMNSTGIFPPPIGYYNGVAEGYRDFGLKLSALKLALKYAHDYKAPSHVERKRMRRLGRPVLKADPRAPKLPMVLPTADRAWKPLPVSREAARATIQRQKDAAREAEAKSRALKAPRDPQKLAEQLRSNRLSDWLENAKRYGEPY